MLVPALDPLLGVALTVVALAFAEYARIVAGVGAHVPCSPDGAAGRARRRCACCRAAGRHCRRCSRLRRSLLMRRSPSLGVAWRAAAPVLADAAAACFRRSTSACRSVPGRHPLRRSARTRVLLLMLTVVGQRHGAVLHRPGVRPAPARAASARRRRVEGAIGGFVFGAAVRLPSLGTGGCRRCRSRRAPRSALAHRRARHHRRPVRVDAEAQRRT